MSHTRVLSVSSDSAHHFTKPRRDAIVLVAGQGVEGDAHSGTTVQHRSRVRRDPTQPNLRQVHLIHRELFDEVDADVSPAISARTSRPRESMCSPFLEGRCFGWARMP